MKKIVLISITLLFLAGIALVLIGVPVSAASVDGAPAPGYVARLNAGLHARFADGHAEIQQSLQNKKNVTSFRMVTTLRLHPGQPLETTTEVVCPDRERFSAKIGEQSFQAVRIGGNAYVEQKDSTWTTQQTAATGWAPCGENPGEAAPWAMMNEGRDITPVLAKMSEKSEISRGQFLGTTAGACQEWILNLTHPGGAHPHGGGGSGLRYAICIDLSSHLPLRIVMGNGSMITTYSDWNKPLQINGPKL